jgi:hypothetical protein
MYPASRNIIYVTINSADTENLLKIGVARDRIFLLPDPLHTRRHEARPLWEMDERELAALGLKSDSHRERMLARLGEYAASKKQIFDDSLPILLSPLKTMRRKNNIEALLLLELFKSLGRRFQLLISLDANSPPDIAYSKVLTQFARSRDMPVVVGFGSEAISESAQRIIENGRVTRYGIGDLYALCSAVVTTSVVEGFGLAYHEGWLAGKPVLGRRIGEIVRDFEDNGMRFDHMYERLAISLDDLPNLRRRLIEAYEQKIAASQTGRRHSAVLTHASPSGIIESKLFHSGGQDCIDFAHLSAEMQIELIDRLRGESGSAKRLIDRNPAVVTAYEILENLTSEPVESLIGSNSGVTRARYSLDAMAQRLKNLFETGDSLYRSEFGRVALTPENHEAIMRKYHSPEHMRLIF